MTKGIGKFSPGEMLERFGAAEAIFREPLEPLPAELSKAISSFDGWARVDKELEAVQKSGARIIAYDDPEYPDALKLIPDPPRILYAKGKRLGEGPAAAIVGTRRPSHYGLRMSESLGKDLAGAGVTVVSGLARGCDTAAHKGAVSAGDTVAVLGTGVDVCYPKENRKLYEEICGKGTLVSEFPMGTGPFPFNFPLRNRIISGLSKGVIVVEAPLRSGALMTARLALEGGREVFAVPGPVTSTKSAGTNRLIKEGAFLVEGAPDVLAVFGIFQKRDDEDKDGGRAATAPMTSMSGDELAVWKALGDEPLHIDSLAEKTGLSAAKTASLLLGLELKGKVKQLPGMSFLRNA